MWPRWIRALATLWVAWDSRRRKDLDLFWVIAVLLLGPLLIPVYLTLRPLMKGERRVGGFFWNLFVNIENLLSWIAGLAAAAVFVENISIPHNKNLAEVKRAEIKAGTIVGTVIFIVLIGFEKIGFEHLRNYIEQKYFS